MALLITGVIRFMEYIVSDDERSSRLEIGEYRQELNHNISRIVIRDISNSGEGILYSSLPSSLSQCFETSSSVTPT